MDPAPRLPDYIFLIRHASQEIQTYNPPEKHPILNWEKRPANTQADFDTPGKPLASALAGRLCNELSRSAFEGIKIVAILFSDHLVAQQTAGAFKSQLRRHGLLVNLRYTSHPKLNPDSDTLLSLEDLRLPATAGEVHAVPPRTGCLVVGHQPQLTRIADRLMANRNLSGKLRQFFNLPFLPGNILPLGNSEIACLSMENDRYRLRWLLTNKMPPLMQKLRRKVRTRYEAARFLLGALLVSYSLFLREDLWLSSSGVDFFLTCLGALLALVALGLMAVTLLSYDRLLMPTDFWPEDKARKSHRRISRPPSQPQIVLFYEDHHVWTHLFIPALSFALGSFVVFTVRFAHLSAFSLNVKRLINQHHGLFLSLAFYLVLLLAVLGYWYYQSQKPHFGYEE